MSVFHVQVTQHNYSGKRVLVELIILRWQPAVLRELLGSSRNGSSSFLRPAKCCHF